MVGDASRISLIAWVVGAHGGWVTGEGTVVAGTQMAGQLGSTDQCRADSTNGWVCGHTLKFAERVLRALLPKEARR